MRQIGEWFGLVADGDAAVDALYVAVLGCPFDGAASGRRGAAQGPAAIREWASSAEAIDERGVPVQGLRVVDHGDVESSDDPHAAIVRAGVEALDDGAAVLLGLGGDHGVTPPLLEAVVRRHPDVALLLIDAHPDCFEEYGGRRDSHACVVSRAWDSLGLAPERTALVGLRSYAAEELPALQRAGAVVSAAEWHELGSAAVRQRILDAVGDGPLYVSLDIDALDSSAAPGTGYPVPGGPSTRELLELLCPILQSRRVVGFDLVEVAPALDPSGVTAATAAHVLLQVLAALAAGRKNSPRTPE